MMILLGGISVVLIWRRMFVCFVIGLILMLLIFNVITSNNFVMIVTSTITSQYRKERDDLQQKIRVLEFDCNQLRVARNQAEESNGHLTLNDFELREEISGLKLKSRWKDYAIGALLITLIVVAF